MLKKGRKKFLEPSLYPDPHQRLFGSILDQNPSSKNRHGEKITSLAEVLNKENVRAILGHSPFLPNFTFRPVDHNVHLPLASQQAAFYSWCGLPKKENTPPYHPDVTVIVLSSLADTLIINLGLAKVQQDSDKLSGDTTAEPSWALSVKGTYQ